MKIQRLHSYLVHPAKALAEKPEVRGTVVQSNSSLFPMLQRLFDGAARECRHAIAFVPDTPGVQKNECLEDIANYSKQKTLAAGRKVAERLQRVTTLRSGMGLLFLITGQEGGTQKTVVSRFPAEQGVLAEEKGNSLTVEFLEKVFMKSATSYKAATFSGATPLHDYWKGHAVDKQINNAESAISEYWIRDFLCADFLTPGELGTRRFASAMRDAISRTPNVATKIELSAACQLLKSFDRRVMSAKELLNQLGLSPEAQQAVKGNFSKGRLFEEQFRFVATESAKLLAFKTVELDNGGMLSALSDQFDRVFEQQQLKTKNAIRFTTEGVVVAERFRKGRV